MGCRALRCGGEKMDPRGSSSLARSYHEGVGGRPEGLRESKPGILFICRRDMCWRSSSPTDVYTGFLSVTTTRALCRPEEFRRWPRVGDEAGRWNTLYYVLGR